MSWTIKSELLPLRLRRSRATLTALSNSAVWLPFPFFGGLFLGSSPKAVGRCYREAGPQTCCDSCSADDVGFDGLTLFSRNRPSFSDIWRDRFHPVRVEGAYFAAHREMMMAPKKGRVQT